MGLERTGAAALAIVGEPGMGKTRLLAELRARAEARGLLVLTGSASELEQELPFSVFVDALEEYLRGLEPGRLAGLDEGDRAQLAHVFPSLEAGADGATSRQDERFRAHRRTRPGTRDGGRGVDTLTGRELEVARLVVDRKTNPQIAAELFLSPKTVESHIRRLFQKLSVSSRVEVARVVEKADREREDAARA